MHLQRKLYSAHWLCVVLFCLIGGVGILLLYSTSASTNGIPNTHISHLQKLILACLTLIITALIDLKFFYRYAYVFYWMGILSLLYLLRLEDVEVKRWIDFGVLKIQPSEFMKIALILVLARFFDSRCLPHIHKMPFHETSLLVTLIALPVILVMMQPNLGTASMILFSAIAVCFLAGVEIRRFLYASLFFILSIPFLWMGILHDYQKDRILGLNEQYNSIQSQIAIGGGGWSGTGWQQGTQTQFGFLPEKNTDFIFAVLGEEFGFIGCSLLLFLYVLLILWGWVVTNRARQARQYFTFLLASSLTVLIFLYVFTNIAMVIGLLPVVGLPLPLVSYGGSSGLSFGLLCGLLLNIALSKSSYKDRKGRPIGPVLWQ